MNHEPTAAQVEAMLANAKPFELSHVVSCGDVRTVQAALARERAK